MTDIQITPLVADIISAQLQVTHAVTDRLVESLQYQLAEAQAREKAIEQGVLALLRGPWMPTPDAITKALYPSRELIEHFRRTTSADHDGMG